MTVDDRQYMGKNDNDSAKTYKEQCPVCTRDVDSELEYTYHGVPHHFCCNHCRSRFQRRPHLYVGSPRLKLSVKQQGKTVPKSHHIGLPNAPDETLASRLCERVSSLPGVGDCRVSGSELVVAYDLLIISLKAIEHAVVELVGDLKGTLLEKSKRKALHFAEECELDNLAHLSDSGKQYQY